MLHEFCSKVAPVVLEVSPGDEGASEEVEFGDEVRHALIFIAANDHQSIVCMYGGKRNPCTLGKFLYQSPLGPC